MAARRVSDTSGDTTEGPTEGAAVGYRERILAAGSAVFREKGFAGARVDEIARLAGCNKQLIYYYFDDKSGLYEESLKRMFSNTHECHGEDRLGDGDLLSLLRCTLTLGSDPESDWPRLWLWESIERDPADITLKHERREAWERFVSQVRAAQDREEVDPALDTDFLALSILSISSFPLLFPHLAQLITGCLPGEPAFGRRQETFLRDFAAMLAANARDHSEDRAPEAADGGVKGRTGH